MAFSEHLMLMLLVQNAVAGILCFPKVEGGDSLCFPKLAEKSSRNPGESDQPTIPKTTEAN